MWVTYIPFSCFLRLANPAGRLEKQAVAPGAGDFFWGLQGFYVLNTRSKITSLVCITALVISAVSLFMNYRTISGNTRAEITHSRSLIKKERETRLRALGDSAYAVVAVLAGGSC